MFPERDPAELKTQPNWSEPRVERLLGWFFAQEMPPELQESVVRLPSPRPAHRTAGRWLLPLCVAVLWGSVWVVQPLPRRALPEMAFPSPARGVEFETTSLPVTSELVTYAGLRGSFEQRSELRWTSHSYFEPEAGVWVEWSAPELVIDVETVGEARTP